MTRSRRDFPLVDSMRGIAALTILAYHAAGIYGHALLPGHVVAPYVGRMEGGVSLFLLVSGFLLYRPFVVARMTGDPVPGLRRYARRRVLRIFPAYWIALTVSAAVLGLSYVFTAHGFLRYYGLTQLYSSSTLHGGIGVAWTLCLEITFYAFLPVWALAMRRRRAAGPREVARAELIAVGALILASVAFNAVVLAVNGPRLYEPVTPLLSSLPAFLDQFGLGMALAVVSAYLQEAPVRSPRALRVVEARPGLSWLAAGAFFVLAANLTPALAPYTRMQILERNVTAGIIALFALLPAVFGHPHRGPLRRVLSSRVLIFLGAVSYGIYLWHPFVLTELNNARLSDAVGARPVPWVLITAAATIPIAAASWYGVERPLLRWRRRPRVTEAPAAPDPAFALEQAQPSAQGQVG